MPKLDKNDKPKSHVKVTNNYDLSSAINEIRWMPTSGVPALTASDKATLHYLGNFLTAGKDIFSADNRVNPSIRKIADDLGLTDDAARRRIARLRCAGWIWTEEQRRVVDSTGEVRQTSSRYFFSPALFYAAKASSLWTSIKKMEKDGVQGEDLKSLEADFQTSAAKTIESLAETKNRNLGHASVNGRKGQVAKIEKQCDKISRELMQAVKDGETPDNLIQLFKSKSEKIAALKSKIPKYQPQSQTHSTPPLAFTPPPGLSERYPRPSADATLNTHIKYPPEVSTLNKSHCEKPNLAVKHRAKTQPPSAETSEILDKLDSLDVFNRFANALGQKQETNSAKKQLAKSIAQTDGITEALDMITTNLDLLETVPPLQDPREDGKKHSLGRLLSDQLSVVAESIEAKTLHEISQRQKSFNGAGKGRIIVEYAMNMGWCPMLAHKWLTKKSEDPAKIQACVDAVLAQSNPCRGDNIDEVDQTQTCEVTCSEPAGIDHCDEKSQGTTQKNRAKSSQLEPETASILAELDAEARGVAASAKKIDQSKPIHVDQDPTASVDDTPKNTSPRVLEDYLALLNDHFKRQGFKRSMVYVLQEEPRLKTLEDARSFYEIHCQARVA